MIYPIVAALAFAASASAKLYTEDNSQQKYMWESFKRDHSRSYATMEEENQRFGHFLENLKVADLRNLKEKKAGGSASHGITKFSDLSQAEFESRFLLADKSKKEKNPTVMCDVAAPTSTTEMDWSGVLTTPVKDQVKQIKNR